MAANATRKPSNNYRPLGVSGLPRYSGYVFDEWLHDLQGPRGRKVLREMADNSAVIGALKFAIENLIRQVPWTVAPGIDNPAGKEAAKLVDEALHDMEVTWQDVLADILTMLDYGWSLFEIVFKKRDGTKSKYDDGKIGWLGWQMRGQETLLRWDYPDYHANFPDNFVQLGPPDFIEHTIPMERCLLFRTTTRRSNPEGRSLWRNAYHSWYMQKHLEAIEAIGAERDMAGLPIGYVPSEILDPNSGPEEKAAYTQWTELVTHIRRDEQEGVLIPSDRDESGNLRFDLKLLSTGGQRQFNLGDVIERHEQRMLMTCLGDFIMLGHSNVGTQSLGRTKIELFSSAITSFLSIIASQINDVAIPQLLRLNGMDTKNPPTLVHGEVERMDLDLLGNFLYQMGQSGFVLDTNPQGPLTKHLMQQAHLPLPPEDLQNPAPEDWQNIMPNPQSQNPNVPLPGANKDVTGATRTSIREPNMPNTNRVKPPDQPQKAPAAQGQVARAVRQQRKAMSEQEQRDFVRRAGETLDGLGSLSCVAFDLDNTALLHPEVLRPLATILKKQGVQVGVLTGNPTIEAHLMWNELGYPSPDFYSVHPDMDGETTAQWKANQCKKLGVDLIIDDFSGGRHAAVFEHFVKQNGANTVALEVLRSPNDEYQQVGKGGM